VAGRLRARVQQTLRERALLPGVDTLLVACSGGPDSQALLHVLAALREEHAFRLLAAGVDHGLRVDAVHELASAGRLAAALDVPFAVLRVEVEPGPSRQAQARAARYRALLAHAREQHAQAVAVGHTLDDQAETVLARLLRGTGVEGLSAIDPRRPDGVLRPLVDAPRSLVRAYLVEQALEFASDPSNADPRYLRTRIRERVLPALLAENPRACEALAHLADDAREAAALLNAHSDQQLARAAGDLAPLRASTPAEQRRLLKRLVENEVGVELRRRHVEALQRSLHVGGEVRLPGGISACFDPGGGVSFATVSKRGRGSPRPTKQPKRGA
jgi:tRNA(Ile)-lysidine synthase